jgi:stringent starvation protein B
MKKISDKKQFLIQSFYDYIIDIYGNAKIIIDVKKTIKLGGILPFTPKVNIISLNITGNKNIINFKINKETFSYTVCRYEEDSLLETYDIIIPFDATRAIMNLNGNDGISFDKTFEFLNGPVGSTYKSTPKTDLGSSYISKSIISNFLKKS